MAEPEVTLEQLARMVGKGFEETSSQIATLKSELKDGLATLRDELLETLASKEDLRTVARS